MDSFEVAERVGQHHPDIFANMLRKHAKEHSVLGISSACDVYNDPEQCRARFVTLVRICFPQNWYKWMEALKVS